MPAKSKSDTLDDDLNALIERGFKLMQDASVLARRIEKCPFEELPFDEPLRRSLVLFQFATAANSLARTILTKAQLVESRTTIERTVRARMEKQVPVED
jgi:hypothetical protein